MTRHVLVPIDGSDPAWKALDFAIENADGGRITALHVVDPAESVYSATEGGHYSRGALGRVQERGEELCQEARERAQGAEILDSVTVETAIEEGDPARTIVEYADEHDVDHIVVGSHGRSGVSRVLLGSVAETVTRRAAAPVTVV